MHRRLLIEWCLIAAAAVAVIVGLQLSHATDRIDNAVYDVLVGVRAPAPSDRIMLVTIDDSSIAALGRWPWPRTVHAAMLERAAAAHPAAIAYDVLFTEQSGVAGVDERLGAAIRTAGNVTMPVLFETPGHDGRAIDALPPIPQVADTVRALGHVALLPDRDGVTRSLLLSIAAGGREWPHMMEEAYEIAAGHASPVASRLAARGEARVGVPFQSSSGAFRTISFSSILAGEVPPQFLRGRILLVGVTASGLGDRFRVPTRTGGLMSGIEVQANLLNSLLADRMVKTPPMAVCVAAALAPAGLLLVLFWRLRPASSLVVAVGLIGLVLVVPVLLLVFADLWLAPAPALIGLLFVYPLWGWRRLQAVDRVIGLELQGFAAEPGPVPLPAARLEPLDAIGGQAARLRAAIANMRDLRRLVSDTIDGVGDPLFVTDLGGTVILANRGAARLSEALGKGAVEGLPVAALFGALANHAVTLDALPAELAHGQDRIFSLRRFLLRDHEDRQQGWIFHLADISDIRRAQGEREEALEFLSHDMRAPQSSIIALLERHGGEVGEDGLAERITRLARKTLTLADNFVELARFSVTAFAPEEADLAGLLTEAADELWPLASRRQVQIVVDGGDDPCYLMAERDALTRAFINLLDNAVKFSPEGGTVRCAVRSIGGGRLECTIEDEGPGIPPERRQSLFARFGYRKRAAGIRQSVGLGLAFVGVAIERHGGTIHCEERQPHGTRFVLSFPSVE